MNVNGINFTEEWLDKFTNADEFVNHPKQQRLINENRVTSEALALMFELYNQKKNGSVNQGVSEQVQETKPKSSNRANSERKAGNNSRSAGNTNEPGGEG